MPWKQHVLVVANQTAGSSELLSALRERAQRAPTAVYLVVPATRLGGGREKAIDALANALSQFRVAGLEADGAVGHSDPFVAATDAWDPKRYDEIIVSTLPIGVSKWLPSGLPARIAAATGALVTHVASQPPTESMTGRPRPPHDDLGVLTPFAVLGWGRQSARRR